MLRNAEELAGRCDLRLPEDKISSRYERLHGDIFNPIEQERLRYALAGAIAQVRTDSKPLTALDYGCGSGNVTRHLIELGVNTVSADISDDFLRGIESRFAKTGLSKTLKVNGRDLCNIADGRFDFAACYSVLHHVPDYLRIIKEMCRVLKSGGVLYIDHEVNESYYARPKEYVEFLRQARPRIDIKRRMELLANVRDYKHIFRRLLNSRYQKEGDIHVWPDDHIDWGKIEELLRAGDFEIIAKQDYLLYKDIYKIDVYNRYKDKCMDERRLTARKR